MLPPVSVPSEAEHRPAAIATAEPPELPPGTRVGSHGLRLGPKAEVSVDEPSANSSMLQVPTMIAPAASRRARHVAEKGERWPSSMRDPQAVVPPS